VKVPAYLINSFLAYPTFRRAYGTFDETYGFQISPAWKLSLNNSSVVGSVFDLFWGGWLSERFGYWKTLAGTLITLSVAVLLAFFAFNIQMLLAAIILNGIPWGFFQTLSTSYASDVTPVALRAYVTSNVNLCWLIGQIIGTGIIRSLVNNESEWSYRILFGLQWAFAVPLTIGALLAPESPWWLVRHERPEDAKRALLRLTTAGLENFNVDETVAMMSHTNEVGKWMSSGGTTYFDCFRGTDLRRTEITRMVWIA
jgi:MFS transporter, SP family, general alpha glucoside:H+ symporter